MPVKILSVDDEMDLELLLTQYFSILVEMIQWILLNLYLIMPY